MAALPKIQEWKQQSVEDTQRKIEEDNAKKRPLIEIYKEKYPKEKPQWPRCDRVTIVAESEFVGEQIPFYNTYKKDGDESKKLFYPNKEYVLPTAPKWSLSLKSPTQLPTDNMKSRDEQYNEKMENMKSAKGLTDKDLMVDVSRSYKLMGERGRYPLKFHKPFDYANTDQYKTNHEQHPDTSPGPTHYWKMKGMDVNALPKDLTEDTEMYGRPAKIYYMNRKRTDFRVYKPMRRSVF